MRQSDQPVSISLFNTVAGSMNSVQVPFKKEENTMGHFEFGGDQFND